jgi:hypothetical protein
MRSLRATWLAVIGSILLLSLSVAGVFGHAASGLDVAASTGVFAAHHESDDPTADADEDADEDTDADEDADEDTDADEDADEDTDTDADEDTDTDADEDTDEDTETDEDTADAPETPTDNHGACVAAVAHSDAVGGGHLNHGGAVSEAARVTCNSTEGPVTPQTDKQAAKDARQAAKDARRAEQDAKKANNTHRHSHCHCGEGAAAAHQLDRQRDRPGRETCPASLLLLDFRWLSGLVQRRPGVGPQRRRRCDIGGAPSRPRRTR